MSNQKQILQIFLTISSEIGYSIPMAGTCFVTFSSLPNLEFCSVYFYCYRLIFTWLYLENKGILLTIDPDVKNLQKGWR